MSYLTFSIRVTSDAGGEPAVVFDYVARVSMTEQQLLAAVQPPTLPAIPPSFTTVPTINQIPVLNALIIASDQQINLRAGSLAPTDGIITLRPGGILCVVDGQIGSGPTTNITVNNPGASNATLSGLAGGT